MTDLPRRERKDVQRNLERVLRAAAEAFAEHGPDVKMEEVARRAGVGVGTIYRRFPSKDQLFAAVSAAACADTSHCLNQAAADAHEPIARLRAIVHVQYHQCAQQAALLDMRPAEIGDDHEAHGLYPTLHALLEHTIAAGQASGHIRPGDPALLAAICAELLNPHAMQHLRRLLADRADRAAEHVAAFVIAGLARSEVRSQKCPDSAPSKPPLPNAEP